MKDIRFYLSFLILLAACSEQSEPIQESVDNVEVEEVEPVVLTDRATGDTVPSNEPLKMGTGSVKLLPNVSRWRTPTEYAKKRHPLKQNKIQISLHRVDPVCLDSGIYLNGQENQLPPDTIPINEVSVKVKDPVQKSLLPMSYKDNAQYDIQYISAFHGLPTSNVNNVLQSKSGHIWMGSNVGLIRYDGQFIKTYDKSSGLPDNRITALAEDSQGRLWIGTETGSLIRFDGDEFFYFDTDSLAAGYPVTNIAIDKSDDPWFTLRFFGFMNYSDHQLLHYGDEQGTHTNRPTTSISFMDNGEVWFTGYGRGLFRLTDNGIQQLIGGSSIRLESGYNHSGFFSSTGDYYVAGWNPYVYIIRNDSCFTYKMHYPPPINGVSKFREDSRGRIWMLCGDLGLLCWEDGYATVYSDNEGLSSQYLSDFWIDRSDQVWIATEGGGISKFNPNSFSVLNKNNGFPDGFVTSYHEAPNGQVFYGASNGVYESQDSVLIQYGGIGVNEQGRAVINIGQRIDGIETLKEGVIICASDNDGMRIFSDAGTYRWGGNMGAVQNPNCVVKDSAGSVWVGGKERRKLYQYQNDTLFQWSDVDSVFLEDIRCMVAVGEADLWLGSNGQGVGHLEGGQIIYYTAAEGLWGNTIAHLSLDRKKRVWIATDRGLNYVQNGKILKADLERQDISNSFKGVLQDKDGNFWLTTDKELVLLKLKEQEQTNWSLDDYDIFRFDQEDGLVSTAFLDHVLYIDKDNRLLAGTKQGLIVKDLNNLSPEVDQPTVSLESITINGRDVDFRSTNDFGESAEIGDVVSFKNYPVKLVLPYDMNSIGFRYSGLNWTSPADGNYYYRLIGWDEEWSVGSSDNYIQFRNLHYGKYTFEVKRSLSNGIESEVFSYEFEILRPWWHTWWARTFFVLIGLLAIWLVFRVRTLRLKQKQRELEYKIEEATEEIRQQKEEVESQKNVIEEAHREITDSINYAERIQRSFLATKELLDENLDEYFVYFQPKEAVSGDFYWAGKLSNGDFAVVNADSTGHGVPGAIMSILNISSIERSVEKGLTQPFDIFNDTRQTIIERLKKDGSAEGGRDGMDASLITFNKEKSKMRYVAAHNPIWVVRGEELIDIRAEKMPVGKHDLDDVPFAGGELDLQKGDVIYTMTDGFQDQFGGEKGKKFKVKPLKKLLLENAQRPLSEQKDLLKETFVNWKGSLEQIDDVCLVGIRV